MTPQTGAQSAADEFDTDTSDAPMRRDRFNARLTAEQKRLFEQAARLTGQSVSQFVMTSAQRIAEETIREHEVITLSARDSRAIMGALLRPQPAGPRLRRAAERYKALMGDQ